MVFVFMVGLVNVRFDFNTVVQEALAAHHHAATVKSLKLVLTADPVRVGQIMTALVPNAVQFPESGEVRVGLRELGPCTCGSPRYRDPDPGESTPCHFRATYPDGCVTYPQG